MFQGGKFIILQESFFVNNGIRIESILSRLPRTLYCLWDGYMVGWEVMKPAKLYSSQGRGYYTKHKYNRGKIVWAKIKKIFRVGYMLYVAINLIVGHYGCDKITTNTVQLI